MSLLISQQSSISSTEEGPVSEELLCELQETIARLQLLVCELLAKNQQLRFQHEHE
jgi:hypothetical protein